MATAYLFELCRQILIVGKVMPCVLLQSNDYGNDLKIQHLLYVQGSYVR